MLRSINEVIGYRSLATDGKKGKVCDLFFNDDDWQVKYLAVDIRRWLIGRRVLIPISYIKKPDWSRHMLPMTLTKKKLRLMQPIGDDAPVSQQTTIERYFLVSDGMASGSTEENFLVIRTFEASLKLGDISWNQKIIKQAS